MDELDPRALEEAKKAIGQGTFCMGPWYCDADDETGECKSCLRKASVAAYDAVRAYLAAVSKKEKETPNLPTGLVSVPIVKPEDVKGEKE